ncbi:hypothetical protein HY212_06710 [Candidatus Pacearchaeota archaeon]|nr:hypothetical protein [Candidatus Pacearchaeota archaeon]
MEFKKLKEIENYLFKRKEVQFSVNSNITPSHEAIQKLASEKFSADQEAVAIKKIHARFGSNNFIITANIYSSKEDKLKTEPKVKEKKK